MNDSAQVELHPHFLVAAYRPLAEAPRLELLHTSETEALFACSYQPVEEAGVEYHISWYFGDENILTNVISGNETEPEDWFTWVADTGLDVHTGVSRKVVTMRMFF